MVALPPENVSTEVPSKYRLVIAVAKRAKQIIDASEPGVVLPHKPVTIAQREIESGKIRMVLRSDTPNDSEGDDDPVQAS